MAVQTIDFSEPHVSTAVWLTQLRWVAVAGQLLVIGFVQLVLKIDLPIPELLALIACTAISNVGVRYWAAQVQRRVGVVSTRQKSLVTHTTEDSIGSTPIGCLLVFDVLILTGLLYYTGGAANPFIYFYFANIAVAGIILSRFWAILLSSISVVGSIWLLHYSHSIDVLSGSPLAHDSPWGVSKLAFLIAFSTCCVVLTYFVSMLALEVRLRDRQLAIVEKERERAQRLEALATLAAGAGHELASPLSTIAVIAGELSRRLEKHEVPESVRKDFGLIRGELNRCKDILHRMKSGAGEAAAEHLHPVTLREILDETINAMREPNRVLLDIARADSDQTALLPKQGLSQALRNLMQNGLDASLPNQQVIVQSTINCDDEKHRNWVLRIMDSGTGLSEEVERRIGEPFFTTKEVGEGMGLGVFLTRNVIQGLDGTLVYSASPTGGTICTVNLPLDR